MYFGERLMMLNVEQSSLNSKRYIKPPFFYGIEHSRITWFATLITVVSAGNCSFLYDKQFDFNILNITFENYLKFGSIQLKRRSILSEYLCFILGQNGNFLSNQYSVPCTKIFLKKTFFM